HAMHQRLGAGGNVPSISSRAFLGSHGSKGCVSMGCSVSVSMGCIIVAF
ncbi:MAG: hypothetical protein HXO24_09595, partial [Prevotella sp.]|nr:hypothetical protein [Prevotella sp.]